MRHRYIKLSVRSELMDAAVEAYARRHQVVHVTYAEVAKEALNLFLEQDEIGREIIDRAVSQAEDGT